MSSLCLRVASQSSRPASLCLSRPTSRNPWWLTRNLHSRRPLKYPIEEGLGDFLPPEALKTIAVEYQEGLLERLNDEVRGTEHENQSVAQTVISTSDDRSKTLAFNYASLALNNSFFLDHLKPPRQLSANHEGDISYHLKGAIRSHHGGLDQLKSTFSAAALGMVGSGYIWFVTDSTGATAVLPTFGAGTLLVRARMQAAHNPGAVLGEDIEAWEKATVADAHPSTFRGTAPLPTANSATVSAIFDSKPASPASGPSTPPTSPVSGVSSPLPPLDPSTPSRSLHSTAPRAFDNIMANPPLSIYSSPDDMLLSGLDEKSIIDKGETLHPLFCVSVQEHAWMSAGYGVWGKEEYLKRFWSCLDWELVAKAYGVFSPQNAASG